jgi:serine/threonine-protein kinase RsbW
MDEHADSRQAIEIRIAATPEWIPVARAVATQLADRANFDGDATTDIRVAVDEACAAAAAQTPDDATVTCTFTVAPGRIDMQVTGPASRDPAPFAALSWRLLRAVTDELTLRHHPGHLFSISLSKTV